MKTQLDALEDLRVQLISRIETRAAEFKFVSGPTSEKQQLAYHNGAIAAYHEAISMVVVAKQRAIIAEATEALNEAGNKYGF